MWQNLKSIFLDSAYKFCETTPLHGFNYLVMKSNTKLERIFWLIVVILSFIVGIVLVTLLWAWNTNAPTIAIVETTSYNIRNVPFPAVTICNFNAISKNKSLELARTLNRPENITIERVAELFLLTINENDPGSTSRNHDDKESIKNMLLDNNLNVGILLETLQPNCMDMFYFCLWEGVIENCQDLFQPVAVETTICCSTNYFARKKTKEMKIAKRVLKGPLRSYGTGYSYGLTIGIRSNGDDYFGTSVNSQGFTVYIHDSYTNPIPHSKTIMVANKRENFIQLIPTVLYTTAEAAALSPKERNCLLPHEMKMKFAKYYTLNNCLFECESMWRVRVCGCLFPLLIGNPSRSNCTLEQYWCLMRLLNFQDDGPKDIPKSLYCNCLPECNKNDYDLYMTSGRLIQKVIYSGNKSPQATISSFDTAIHVFFGEAMATRIRRDISEDWFTTLCK